MVTLNRNATTTVPDVAITGPLDHLRGTIRRYVLLEGILLAAIFVAIWFILGLLLDFGLFKATTWDWVLDAPAALRALALALMATLLVALVARLIVLRLTKDFSYPALALVLERRFPDALGDRLITAVELADVKAATSYGYSAEMIRAVIDEARARVARVPVQEVFNWHRLWRLSGILAALWIILLVGAVLAYVLSARQRSPEDFVWKTAHVVTIWGERNIALKNTPWPRQAHLEYVDFPNEELRVAKDAALTQPVVLRVRAVKWVIADPATPLGWRPLLWNDIPQLLDDEAYQELPTSLRHHGGQPVTVDDVELDKHVESAMRRLNALADDPANARRVRRLEIPSQVSLSYEGNRTQSDATMRMESANEFVGELKELKESVDVRIWAADFRMPIKRVTLVPSPMLSRLVRTQYEPAYLYHAPPFGETYAGLRGHRQRMPEQEVSLTGDRSVFSVPAGTEVILTATADKPLKAAFMRPKVGHLPGAKPGSDELIPLTIDAKGEGFSTELPPPWLARVFPSCNNRIRVNESLEFDLVFEDTDGIRSVRPILIQKIEDQPPTVDLAVDVLRRQGSVFLATPAARVPFITESLVRDDRGLSQVEYVFEYSQVEAPVVVALQGQLIARLWSNPPAPAALPSLIMPVFDATVFRVLSKTDARRSGNAILSGFNELNQALVRETRAKFEDDLTRPLPADHPALIRVVKIENPQKDFFDIQAVLKDLVVPPTEIQPRYRIDLHVQATDTNIETGPKKGRNLEPIRLLIISEADLLVEISKEEEGLILRMDEALKRLREAQRKISEMAGTYTTVPQNELINLAVRGVDIAQDVAKAREVTAGILVDYRRILAECEVNRMQSATIDRYRNVIVNPLSAILEDASVGSYRNAEMALASLQAPLNESRRPDAAVMESAESSVRELVARMQDLREKFGESLNISKLRDQIQAILKRQQDVKTMLDDLAKNIRERLFQPDVRPAGPVALAKGETRKVKHSVDWKLYDKDDLVIRLEASDPSLTVPPMVKVPADDLEFEYPITAGQKSGEFTVTVSPAVGKLVTVRVTVK